MPNIRVTCPYCDNFYECPSKGVFVVAVEEALVQLPCGIAKDDFECLLADPADPHDVAHSGRREARYPCTRVNVFQLRQPRPSASPQELRAT